MNIIKAVLDQKKIVKSMKDLPVYSAQWWEMIPKTVTFVPEEQQGFIVFAVVYGGIQM